MPSPLTARLEKLEGLLPDERPQRRVIQVIARHDEDAGPILAAQGYDPYSDFAIIRRIVACRSQGPALSWAETQMRRPG